MPKRRKADDEVEDDGPTPRKSVRRSARTAAEESQSPAETASRRKGILKHATPSKANGLKSVEATPSAMRKVLFATPKADKEDINGDDEDTPIAARNDRSARRKRGRILQQQIVEVDDSDGEADERDAAVAQAILGGEDEEEDEDEIELNPSSAPDTPSKTGRPRGRPKGKRRERTPSPPPNLPSHELYFLQNKAGANKTSANTLPSQLLLSHEDYFAQIAAYKDPHTADIERLKQLHKPAFDQWVFELEEGFNICLYGYGSKRKLLLDFATHVYHQSTEAPKMIIVNGYTPNLTIRDILTTVAGATLPKNTKLPAQPQALLELLLAEMTSPITIMIHSLDRSNLRKSSTQSTLASLAAHPHISLVATCDTPNFPLLWPTALTTQFRFLFHDATTFEPYTAELEVVEDVNALLGRSSRRLGGKDGVGYVLKSLPENARRLFAILVAEQMALADTELDAGGAAALDSDNDDDILRAEDEEEAAAETPSRKPRRGRPAKKNKTVEKTAKKQQVVVTGVEYRTLYHKAVEEFVCSSEVNFRTLLKEFHDHQMIESRKDPMGTERLVVPFRREELEAILEELV
ncbi:Origin recognition complex subunit 2 [Fulvia fulva]|nr:Origin recognition complex subunit 2 [Fulvia fulva]KAK4623203.1 Origin recognition complex subunit 2 [Fulvia fulva]WPV16464.1 Origin recognition complex subunit 2 [Fulvia fulva]WPV30754.1 Origin recognition complex subunit 2 [Fulvia fulva]